MRDVVHINLDDVVILLEDGPHSLGQLAAWLRVTVPTVHSALIRLRRQGRVTTVGVRKLWTLTGAAAPATTSDSLVQPPPEVDPGPSVVDAAADTLAFEDDTAVEADADAELADEFFQPVRRYGPRSKAALRQAAASNAGSSGPAWWVGLDREALNRHATTSANQMGATKIAASISPLRGLSR